MIGQETVMSWEKTAPTSKPSSGMNRQLLLVTQTFCFPSCRTSGFVKKSPVAVRLCLYRALVVCCMETADECLSLKSFYETLSLETAIPPKF